MADLFWNQMFYFSARSTTSHSPNGPSPPSNWPETPVIFFLQKMKVLKVSKMGAKILGVPKMGVKILGV